MLFPPRFAYSTIFFSACFGGFCILVFTKAGKKCLILRNKGEYVFCRKARLTRDSRTEFVMTKSKIADIEENGFSSDHSGNSDIGVQASNTPIPERPQTVSFDPFRLYLDEIKRYPLLSREEETDLAIRYREKTTSTPDISSSPPTSGWLSRLPWTSRGTGCRTSWT